MAFFSHTIAIIHRREGPPTDQTGGDHEIPATALLKPVSFRVGAVAALLFRTRLLNSLHARFAMPGSSLAAPRSSWTRSPAASNDEVLPALAYASIVVPRAHVHVHRVPRGGSAGRRTARVPRRVLVAMTCWSIPRSRTQDLSPHHGTLVVLRAPAGTRLEHVWEVSRRRECKLSRTSPAMARTSRGSMSSSTRCRRLQLPALPNSSTTGRAGSTTAWPAAAQSGCCDRNLRWHFLGPGTMHAGETADICTSTDSAG